MSRPVYLPNSLEELWAAIDRQPEASLYAGGTDLLVRMREGHVSPAALICLERINALQGLEDHKDRLFIRAGTTHTMLLNDPSIGRHLPILAKALRVLGSPPIRHMGTIGGNIVTASPAGDTLPPLYVLDAEVDVLSRQTSRRLKLSDFILGPGKTDLKPGEILGGVWLKKTGEYNVHHFEKVGQRNALAIAVVSLAALLKVGASGRIERARLAWGSVGPTVVSSERVNKALIGRKLTLEALGEVAAMARAEVAPIDDLRAAAWYRRRTAGNLVLRLLDYEGVACESKGGT